MNERYDNVSNRFRTLIVSILALQQLELAKKKNRNTIEHAFINNMR